MKGGGGGGYPPRLLVHGEKPGDYVLVWQSTSPRPSLSRKEKREEQLSTCDGGRGDAENGAAGAGETDEGAGVPAGP